MAEGRKLRLNWIEGRSTLSGGIKSNRLMAEAMQRRGHEVTTSFLTPVHQWPRPWRIRTFLKRLWRAILPNSFPHHLEHSTVNLNQMPTRELNPDLVPDADVSFASWWQVWDLVSRWPASKGLKVHYVRHHEIHGGKRSDVDAAYLIPGPRVVISSWLGSVMKDYGHSDTQMVRVPNGVDWKQFESQEREKASEPIIGMLMGTESFKDTPTGVRAIRILQERVPGLRVIAFGKRPPPAEWDLPECVEHHRSPAQDLIPKLYQQANCWVITSSAEGFGMPGIEAAASHCPLVSTRCGGPEDFVREGENGFMIDVGDAEAMADAIERVLNLDDDEWKKMSKASYSIAREFDWDRSAEKLEAQSYKWLDERDGAGETL
ncbi:MAG: glycosyltransferase family 4 protein [Phycisphaerales bacterium]|nr:glycosyltransferase family 4 protein [Phycisphaerales bacterium]